MVASDLVDHLYVDYVKATAPRLSSCICNAELRFATRYAWFPITLAVRAKRQRLISDQLDEQRNLSRQHHRG